MFSKGDSMVLGYCFFALTVISHTIGQLLERTGMSQVGAIGSVWQIFSWETIKAIATNPYVLGGIACSFIGLVSWLITLSHFKVSYIYPLGSISYIFVVIAARIILQEPVSFLHFAGVMLIVAGVFMLNV